MNALGWLPDRREIVVLALIAAAGITCLPMPFGGDQALFILCARGIDSGAALYRDVWDSKPPGIYMFFLLAGRLFGFTQIGGHALELLYMLVFSFVLLRTSRSYLEQPLARSALPLFAVGIYYTIAEAKHMAQVEVLAGFPIYLALWFGTSRPGSPTSARRAFAAGLAGGAVAWLKIYFLPIVAAIWTLALIRSLGEPDGPLRACGRRMLATGAGFALAAAGLVAWVFAAGVQQEFWWTVFVYPRSAVAELKLEPERMNDNLLWFATAFAVCLFFAAWAAVSALGRRRRQTGGMLGGAAISLLVAVALVAAEVSWWKYYMLIWTVPLAVVAAIGLDRAWGDVGRRGKLALSLIAAILVFPPIQHLSWTVEALLQHRGAIGAADRVAFREQMHTEFASSLREAEFIQAELGPDDTVHVFGNPLVLLLSGRMDAIPINGWAPQTWSDEVWGRVLAQIREARPTYIYCTSYVSELMKKRYPPLRDYMHAQYSIVAASGKGAWLALRPEQAVARGGPAL